METFIIETLSFLCALTATLWSVVKAEGCDAELWSYKAAMKIRAPTSYFTEKLFSGDTAVDECREWCNGESGCRAVSLVETIGQKTCMMYNHSVVILESDANSDTVIKDFWESDDNPICPPTSVWDAPDNWPIDAIPSFYQPLDKRACVEMNGTEWSYGKFGNGLMSLGAPHYADVVINKILGQSSSLFCWLTPASCPDGMSFALWAKIIFQNGLEPVITTIKAVGADRSDGFSLTLQNALSPSVRIAMEIQTATQIKAQGMDVPLESGVWTHFGFTFSPTEEIKIYRNGQEFPSNSVQLDNAKAYNQPQILRLGKTVINDDFTSSSGRWDEIIAFNKVLSDSQMSQLSK